MREDPSGPLGEPEAHPEEEGVEAARVRRLEEVRRRLHGRFYDCPCIVHHVALRIQRSGDLEG